MTREATTQAPAPLLVDTRQPAGESLVRRIGPDGDLVSLAELARRLPRIDGRKIHISSIVRWCRKGLRGTRLEYVRVGRKICTTHEALLRFFAELSALDRQTPPPRRPAFLGKRPVTPKQRLRALQEADAVLERAKI